MNKILVVADTADDYQALISKAYRFNVDLSLLFLAEKEEDLPSNLNLPCPAKDRSNLSIHFFGSTPKTPEEYVQLIIDTAKKDSTDLIMLHKPDNGDENGKIELMKTLLKSSSASKVFLSRTAAWKEQPNILCAVDIGSKKEAQQALDLKVFKLSQDQLTPEISGKLHLATIIEISRVTEELEIIEHGDVVAKKGKDYLDKLETFCHAHSSSKPQLLVDAGVPSKKIAILAKRHDIDLTVIGNIARSGLEEFLVGNTAEKIIRKLATDVLVVHAE